MIIRFVFFTLLIVCSAGCSEEAVQSGEDKMHTHGPDCLTNSVATKAEFAAVFTKNYDEGNEEALLVLLMQDQVAAPLKGIHKFQILPFSSTAKIKEVSFSLHAPPAKAVLLHGKEVKLNLIPKWDFVYSAIDNNGGEADFRLQWELKTENCFSAVWFIRTNKANDKQRCQVRMALPPVFTVYFQAAAISS